MYRFIAYVRMHKCIYVYIYILILYAFIYISTVIHFLTVIDLGLPEWYPAGGDIPGHSALIRS